ncbi:hypothetical protein VTK26DRAFT_9087 [Humicola hyalothermophila]
MPCLEYRTIQSMLAELEGPMPDGLAEHVNNRAYLPLAIQYFVWHQKCPQEPFQQDATELHRRAESWKTEWDNNEYFKMLRMIIDTISYPKNTGKIVAFGSGVVPCRQYGGTQDQFSPADTVQGALMQMLFNRLSFYQPRDVPCFIQDRGWQYIGKHSYQLLDADLLFDPFGFLEVDETTAVIAINPDIPVRQVVTELARPAVLLWRKLNACDPRTVMFDPVSPRVQRMINEEYYEIGLPQDDVFGGFGMYVRRDDADKANTTAEPMGHDGSS